MRFPEKYILRAMLLFFCMACPVFAADDSMILQENGVVENTQVVFLLLSGLVFFAQSFAVARKIRVVLWMGAWFCLSCILRELDVDELAVPKWVILIGSGLGRNLIMGFGWIALGVIAIKSYPELKDKFGGMIRSRTAIFVFASGTVLLFGSLFEHGPEGMHSLLWEEGFEAFGYFLLVPAALFSRAISRT